jgi:tRNA threonylcarbamoyladenosine biosynthesis protein TsaE
MTEIITKSERETEKLAKILAQTCFAEANRHRRKIAIVIGLQGELGSGKTRFVQGFAKGLGIRQRLTSPTFVLMKKYKNLYHIDCYRLNRPKDLIDLDFKEIISNPKNIVLIEWAEKVRKILPKNTAWIRFEVISDQKRKIKIL